MKPTLHLIPMMAIASGLALTGCDDQSPLEPTHTIKQPVNVIRLADNQKIKRHQFTGKLKSSETAAIAFRVPGLIHELLVKPGESVEKGQVVARLDPHDYQVSIRELEARLYEAKASYKLAKIELKRVKQAVKDDAVSSVSLDRAQSGYERAKAMVEVVSQNLQRAKDSLSYTELKAPFDGVIARNNFEAFEQVSPGLSVFTLHKPQLLDVEIDVPENLIDQFSDTISTSASISWYQAERALPAELIEVETLPDPIRQTYTVTYQVDTEAVAKARVLPGKSVTLTTSLAGQSDVFCLPYSAVLGEESEHYVFTVDHDGTGENNTVQSVGVQVDTFQDSKMCVQGRLNSKDLIVVAGGSYLQPGDTVGDIRLRSKEG
ncbi:efflux RND transporter periplasmic adaptor subunit [Photobacterium rosenbergii]|uniref:efflux RND transporter periplasmic adaptor subunit n=1 Tax=Photobacterium rosenbergii TaxID=294936 RepID=UPI0021BD6748|nr:efflux RND transporter periplasmic adaptor subunit [Photobacterium rosenbergii]